MIKGCTTATVTRYQEGASLEDMESGDAYETAYLVYNSEGELIWDTTKYELVKRYFDYEKRDPMDLEDIKELIKADPASISYSHGCDEEGDRFAIMHYNEDGIWTIFERHDHYAHEEPVPELITMIQAGWDTLPQDDTPDDWEYIPHACTGDYGPSNPWDAPGMSIHDFIDFPVYD